jgi:hypothetical protein
MMFKLSTILSEHNDDNVGQITELSEYYSNFLRDICVAETKLEQAIDECRTSVKKHTLRSQDPVNNFINPKLKEILIDRSSLFEDESAFALHELIKAKSVFEDFKNIVKKSFIDDLQGLTAQGIDTNIEA